MKFDCIIMNPPYEKNLHLKILAEAITHLKDDESKVVNLSPVRWLQDPLAKYKKNSDYNKFEKSISKHITYLDVINKENVCKLFSIGINSDLGIYCCKKCGNWKYDSILWIYNGIDFSFMTKYINKIKNGSLKTLVTHKTDGILVPFNIFCGGSGGRTFNGVYASKILATDDDKHVFIHGRRQQKDWKSCRTFIGASFKTKNLAENFIKFINLPAMRCFGIITIKNMHIDNSWAYVPEVSNAINPRTGKKGYESEWTDEDFYKFFNITPDEQKIIEDTMEKCK